VPREKDLGESQSHAKYNGEKFSPQDSFKKELEMKHSAITISQILNDINLLNEKINNTVLIGEKCAMIYDASHVYNKMKSLITPDYLSDEEFIWFKSIGAEWNKTMAEFAKGQTTSMHENGNSPESPQSMEDIEDALKEALDDLMNNLDDDFKQDNGGFDGGDGIW